MSVASAPAQDLKSPLLETNEAYVEETIRSTGLAIGDPTVVFSFVPASLPERVKVYPTENYYYFRFAHNGIRYAGSIRLDPAYRDEGKVHFVYYEDLAEWQPQAGKEIFVVLDASQGVLVERIERLVYRISDGRKNVLFALNDLSQVKPPANALGPDEKFIGPIFDELAVRFFLVYNSRLKIIHYILDESAGLADRLVPVAQTDRLLIGQRTGFAFYRDHRLDRKILIGVFQGNIQVNNYLDGPFDQMPENFVEGETLREIFLAMNPELKGRIDRFGWAMDGAGRYAPAPYREYRTHDELHAFHQCATDLKLAAASYYNCFVIDMQGGLRARPALSKKSPPRGRRRRVRPAGTVAASAPTVERSNGHSH